MKLESVVIDQQTGERLPNATIRISNNDGTVVTGGAYADSNGAFSIDVPETGFILVSSTGYKPAVFPVSLILQMQAAALELSDSSTLPEVVVTAKKNIDGIIVVIALIIGSYFSKKI